jgi:hypothetical protein
MIEFKRGLIDEKVDKGSGRAIRFCGINIGPSSQPSLYNHVRLLLNIHDV